MRITIEKGHHTFPTPREVFDSNGKSKGKVLSVAIGESLEVTAAERKERFTDAVARLSEPEPTDEISYDPKVLADLSAKKLKVMATKLELDFPNNAGQSKMIKIIVAAAPDEEPTIEWGADRLKAYLEKNEITFDDESNLLELAQDHFSA